MLHVYYATAEFQCVSSACVSSFSKRHMMLADSVAPLHTLNSIQT